MINRIIKFSGPSKFVACAPVGAAIGLQGRVTAPADAVLNTGNPIQTVSGVRAGERLVSAGAFLIDSEAQLKGGRDDQPHH